MNILTWSSFRILPGLAGRTGRAAVPSDDGPCTLLSAVIARHVHVVRHLDVLKNDVVEVALASQDLFRTLARIMPRIFGRVDSTFPSQPIKAALVLENDFMSIWSLHPASPRSKNGIRFP